MNNIDTKMTMNKENYHQPPLKPIDYHRLHDNRERENINLNCLGLWPE